MKTHTPNTTTFKLVCFYSHKPDGSPYSIAEKQTNRNRKYHDSYDFVHTKQQVTITRHDLAFLKLVEHVDKHWRKIDTCMLFYNDFQNRKEVKIGQWYKSDFDKTQLMQPIYDKRGIHVHCIGIEGGGIQTYELRTANGYVKQPKPLLENNIHFTEGQKKYIPNFNGNLLR